MYKGFHVKINTLLDVIYDYLLDDHDEEYFDALSTLDSKSKTITDSVAKILQGDSNGIINGDALLQTVMPTTCPTPYHVFISHSHTEEDIAKDFAVYLYLKYGITCFVDGFVWGSCDEDILKPIDNRWCQTKSNTYSYELRNYTTSHVHAMLSMALLEVIDRCECCIFIKPEDEYSLSSIENKTLSPWIYEEITMFNKIEKERPKRVQRCTESFSEKKRLPRIFHKLDLSDMPELQAYHLQKNVIVNSEFSCMGYKKAYAWLDYIYENIK